MTTYAENAPRYPTRYDAFGNPHEAGEFGLYPTVTYDSYDGVTLGDVVRCKNGRLGSIVAIHDLLVDGKVQYLVRYHNRQKGQQQYGHLYRHHIVATADR